jgi:hypothetical protein
VRGVVGLLEQAGVHVRHGDVQHGTQPGLVQHLASDGVEHGTPGELGAHPARERVEVQPVRRPVDPVVRARRARPLTGQRSRVDGQ